jgi:bifunctional DNase/RNase
VRANGTIWVETTIAGVRALDDESGQRSHVVVLADDRGRELAIWIGPFEAIMLAIGLQGGEMSRPFTYELAAGLVTAAARIVEVRITALLDGIFFGAVTVEGADGRNDVDARPSDALNLAIATGAPILVADQVLVDSSGTAGRTEWRDYPLTASDIVDDMRRRRDEQQRQLGIGRAVTRQQEGRVTRAGGGGSAS